MALADIVKRIAGDARREADDLVLAAERDATGVRSEAEAVAAATREQLVAHGRAEAEAEAKTRLASARLGERDRVLGAKRVLVQRVLDDTVARLEALPDEEYAALIAREVDRIARGGERIVLGEADQRRLATYLPPALAGARSDGTPKIEIDGSTAAIDRGVVLLGERMRVEISARALVEGREDRLTALAGDVLFGEAEAKPGSAGPGEA